jgi:hypothetical protein
LPLPASLQHQIIKTADNQIHRTAMKKQFQIGSIVPAPSVRYWLVCALLLAAIAYGLHRYFEYRNQELDKRIEMLNH